MLLVWRALLVGILIVIPETSGFGSVVAPRARVSGRRKAIGGVLAAGEIKPSMVLGRGAACVRVASVCVAALREDGVSRVGAAAVAVLASLGSAAPAMTAANYVGLVAFVTLAPFSGASWRFVVGALYAIGVELLVKPRRRHEPPPERTHEEERPPPDTKPTFSTSLTYTPRGVMMTGEASPEPVKLYSPPARAAPHDINDEVNERWLSQTLAGRTVLHKVDDHRDRLGVDAKLDDFVVDNRASKVNLTNGVVVVSKKVVRVDDLFEPANNNDLVPTPAAATDPLSPSPAAEESPPRVHADIVARQHPPAKPKLVRVDDLFAPAEPRTVVPPIDELVDVLEPPIAAAAVEPAVAEIPADEDAAAAYDLIAAADDEDVAGARAAEEFIAIADDEEEEDMVVAAAEEDVVLAAADEDVAGVPAAEEDLVVAAAEDVVVTPVAAAVEDLVIAAADDEDMVVPAAEEDIAVALGAEDEIAVAAAAAREISSSDVVGTWRLDDDDNDYFGYEIVLAEDGTAETAPTFSTHTTWRLSSGAELELSLRCPELLPSGHFGGTRPVIISGRVLPNLTMIGLSHATSVLAEKLTNFTMHKVPPTTTVVDEPATGLECLTNATRHEHKKKVATAKLDKPSEIVVECLANSTTVAKDDDIIIQFEREGKDNNNNDQGFEDDEGIAEEEPAAAIIAETNNVGSTNDPRVMRQPDEEEDVVVLMGKKVNNMTTLAR